MANFLRNMVEGVLGLFPSSKPDGILIPVPAPQVFESMQEEKEERRLKSLALLSDAHKSLLQPDGLVSYVNYQIFSYIKWTSAYNLPGGDFFRVKEVGSSKDLLLVAGDIISHGENVYPGAFACLIAFLSLRETDPVEILSALNRALFEISRENGGEALALAMWLRADGLVYYAGGIDRLFRQDGKTTEIQEIPTHRVIIGKQEIFLSPLSLQLEPGDNLLISSDGVLYGDMRDDQVSAIVTYTPEIILSPPKIERNIKNL